MSERQWGPEGEWVEVPEHPSLYGRRYRYRRVAHHGGWWHGLEIQHLDRNGVWVSVGKRFKAGFTVGRLVPETEWPSFASGAHPDGAVPNQRGDEA